MSMNTYLFLFLSPLMAACGPLGDVLDKSYVCLTQGEKCEYEPPKDGQDGKDGSDGQDGSDGVDGSDGQQGLPGEIGPQGSQGEVGQQGLPGEAGQDGAQGPIGPTGPQGPAGTSSIVIGAGNFADCFHGYTLFSDGVLILYESGSVTNNNNLGNWNIPLNSLFMLQIGPTTTCNNIKYYKCGNDYRIDYIKVSDGNRYRFLLNTFNPINNYSDRVGSSITPSQMYICN